MITLFRRIRQKLIASGSVSKYLLYAVGEILLVVVGILIALQVSNWNQNRMDAIAIAEYQDRLMNDLYEELSVMESVFDYTNTTRDYGSRAMSVFEKKSLGENRYAGNDFLVDLYQASQIQDAKGSNATFQELLSSGQIGKIKNESLRSLIINYYAYNWGNSIAFTIEDPYRQNIRKEIPDQIQSKIREECGDLWTKARNTLVVYLPENCSLSFNEEISRSAALEILNNDELKKDLRYRMGNLKSQEQIILNYKEDLEKIIQLFEEEFQ